MNILESLVPEYYIEQLNSIVQDFDDMDNLSRASKIKACLDDLNFTELGCGTNRIVFIHEDYPDLVFKVALDDRGIKDNVLERQLSEVIPPNLITKSYENLGVIMSAERIQVMRSTDMREHIDEVIEILRHLSTQYVLNDVGYKQFKNWGLRNGSPVILDYAYLRPITAGMEFICKYKDCGGELAYTRKFSNFKCTKCGCKYSISEIQDEEYYDLLDRGLVIFNK